MAVEPLERPEISGARPPRAWVPIGRAMRSAFDPRKVLIAAVGLLLYRAGAAGIDRILLGPESAASRLANLPVGGVDGWGPIPAQLAEAAVRVAEPARVVIGPFLMIFRGRTTPVGFVAAILLALWGVAVWGIAGGAIGRIAAVELAGAGRVGVGTAIRFALRRPAGLIGAPLAPFLAVFLLALPCVAIGLLYRIPGTAGATIAGALAFVPLFCGLGLTIILVGLAAAWPLMHLTVAAEGEDIFDALSRSYAYVNQRGIGYAILVALAWAFGTLGQWLASWLARAVVGLAGWSLAISGPALDLSRLYNLGSAGSEGRVGPVESAHGVWMAAVALLVHAWAYSYFWSAAAAIYLRLRLDVDGTPEDDIYFPEHDADPFAPEADPAPEPAPIRSAD